MHCRLCLRSGNGRSRTGNWKCCTSADCPVVPHGQLLQAQEFRLFLVASLKRLDLSSSLRVKTAVVNFTTDQNSLEDHFLIRLSQEREAHCIIAWLGPAHVGLSIFQPCFQTTELTNFVQNQRDFLMLEDQLLSQILGFTRTKRESLLFLLIRGRLTDSETGLLVVDTLATVATSAGRLQEK